MAVNGLMAVHYGKMMVGRDFVPAADENLQLNVFVGDFVVFLGAHIPGMAETQMILVQNSLEMSTKIKNCVMHSFYQ